MSSLPGGPADKGGNNFEALWGVDGLVRVLTCQADEIRIEPPGVDGEEYYLRYGSTLEHWQTKRQVSGQKNWSLQLLKSKEVLQFFLEKTRQGESCVFASVSDAPELHALCENARAALDYEEYAAHFLKDERDKQFGVVAALAPELSKQEVFGCLRLMRVEGARECTFVNWLTSLLGSLLTGPAATSLDVLARLYATSIHRVLRRDDILSHLSTKHGIELRRIGNHDLARQLIGAVTATYTAGQRAKLIGHELLHSPTAEQLAAKILGSAVSSDTILVSPAGGGKSVCALAIAEALGGQGMPVLAFRLDRLEPVTTTQALGRALNPLLDESPAIALAQCFPGQPICLVIDQLDFVSVTSGRHVNFFDTVAALLEEIRGLRRQATFHVVLACRQFDFENDHRLRSLLSPDNKPVLVPSLTEADVASAIANAGGRHDCLSATQLALLRLPQNLSLFIEAGLATSTGHTFSTQKMLFDAYWDCKRRSLAVRRPHDGHQWTAVIETLTDEMSQREMLSVGKAKLDQFSPDLLATLVSEGVLTFDGRQYGFGHESFFDYCFARRGAARNEDLDVWLAADAQELFRRSQLRQVLVYLRDEDRPRYRRSLSGLLGHPKIRPHLKALLLDLIASFPEIDDDEFQIIVPLVSAGLTSLRENRAGDHLECRALDAFFRSDSLFLAADRQGHISRWLNSGDAWLLNLATRYLSVHTKVHGDRVAKLVEPFLDCGGEWDDRIRFLLEQHHYFTRGFFELLLRRLREGQLDDARDRFASNGTFWLLFQELPETHPDWCIELAARWLDRQVAINAQNEERHGYFWYRLSDPFGADPIQKSARASPETVLNQLVPSILSAASAFAREPRDGLRADMVWPVINLTGRIGIDDALLLACTIAIEEYGKSARSLSAVIATLRQSDLVTANFLLMHAYVAAPVEFADEALSLLAAEPQRILAMSSRERFSFPRNVIELCSPHCSDEVFRRIEQTVLGLTTEYERTVRGLPYRGLAAFRLAEALDVARRGSACISQIGQWREKFKSLDEETPRPTSYTVRSPIASESAIKMSDDQWLRAIAVYDSEERPRDFEHPEIGGARELAQVLRQQTEQFPERFARLALRFPDETHSIYFWNILYALARAAIPAGLKVAVARRCFASPDESCLGAACELLGEIGDDFLPDDAIDFLVRTAGHRSKDEATEEQVDDPLHYGFNSLRGKAAQAIANLIWADARYLSVFHAVVARLCEDDSLSVRTIVARTVAAVASRDPAMGHALFRKLVDCDDRILATDYVDHFITTSLVDYVDEMRPIVLRMLGASHDKVCEAAGRIACLAVLHHPGEQDLADQALAAGPSCRKGAALVAKDNLLEADVRPWCEKMLIRCFHDEDDEVKRIAANCFWYLWQNPNYDLAPFEHLIGEFLESPAFALEPTMLLYALEESRLQLPATSIQVCRRFLEKCVDQARDFSTALGGDAIHVGKLIFRAYAQTGDANRRAAALDLIDESCLRGLFTAKDRLAEFDR